MDDYAGGASSSLKKTIAELSGFVGNNSTHVQTARDGLRGQLDELIWNVGRKGFEAGYREAHAQIAKHVEETGKFPVTITFSGSPKLSPFALGPVRVRASVQRIRFFKLPSFVREISFWERFKR